MRKEYIKLIEEARRRGMPVSQYLRARFDSRNPAKMDSDVSLELESESSGLISGKTITDDE